MTVEEYEIPVGIVQFHIDGLNGSIDHRRATHLGRVAYRVGIPMAIRIASGVEAIGEELAIEIGDRVDSENAETGMSVPIVQVVRGCMKGKNARIRESRRVAQHAGRLC